MTSNVLFSSLHKKQQTKILLCCELAAVKVLNRSEIKIVVLLHIRAILLDAILLDLRQSLGYNKSYGDDQSHGDRLFFRSKRKFGSLGESIKKQFLGYSTSILIETYIRVSVTYSLRRLR